MRVARERQTAEVLRQYRDDVRRRARENGEALLELAEESIHHARLVFMAAGAYADDDGSLGHPSVTEDPTRDTRASARGAAGLQSAVGRTASNRSMSSSWPIRSELRTLRTER